MSLFHESIPVVLLERGTPRTISALQSTRPTQLTVTLTQSSGNAELLFSLSELTTRLLLLTHSITSASYATLRDTQALRVDFNHLAPELCTLLRRPSQDRTFLAVLSQPDETRHTFEIVQLSNFRLLSHIELSLIPAPRAEVLSTLAARARDAEALAQSVQVELSAARAETASLAAALEQARTQIADIPTLRIAASRADAADAQSGAARAEADEARATAAAEARARADADIARATAEAAADAARADVTALTRELEAVRARADALPQAQRAVTELAAQVRAANTVAERMREELRGARERDRVRGAVMERQESTVASLEARVAELQRDNRRLSDTAQMRTVERDGVQRRLDAALRKSEEMQIVLASDREIIAYLNRELNAREGVTPTGANRRGFGATSRTPSSAGSNAAASRARVSRPGGKDREVQTTTTTNRDNSRVRHNLPRDMVLPRAKRDAATEPPAGTSAATGVPTTPTVVS